MNIKVRGALKKALLEPKLQTEPHSYQIHFCPGEMVLIDVDYSRLICQVVTSSTAGLSNQWSLTSMSLWVITETRVHVTTRQK